MIMSQCKETIALQPSCGSCVHLHTYLLYKNNLLFMTQTPAYKHAYVQTLCKLLTSESLLEQNVLMSIFLSSQTLSVNHRKVQNSELGHLWLA